MFPIFFAEQEADAQVCPEGNGVPLHRGDDTADQHAEEQPRDASGPAEQAVGVENQSCQVQEEQVSPFAHGETVNSGT